MMLRLGLIFTLYFCDTRAAPPDFDYDFSGHQQLAKLLITDCNDIVGQIKAEVGKVQEPTHPVEHVSCSELDGPDGGYRMKLTIHKDDDDAYTDHKDRQRLEIRGGSHPNEDLNAEKGSTYIYAWWFRFRSTLIAGDAGFFHTFQIKCDSYTAFKSPAMTFGLRERFGFHVQKYSENGDSDEYKMMSVDDAKGKWFQAIVKVHYDTNGYAEVTLKDKEGKSLYEDVIEGQFWYHDSEYFYPKWGLYRIHNEEFNEYESQDFQNIQVWKK